MFYDGDKGIPKAPPPLYIDEFNPPDLDNEGSKQESDKEPLPKLVLRRKILSTKTVSPDNNREEEPNKTPSKGS